MKIIKSTIIGLLIANTVFNTMALFFVDKDIRMYIITTMCLGIFIGAITIIYTIEKLSVLIKTIIHVFLSYAGFLVAAFLGKWFPFHSGARITGSIIFIIIFIICWTVFYFMEKKEIAVINKKISEKKA